MLLNKSHIDILYHELLFALQENSDKVIPE